MRRMLKSEMEEKKDWDALEAFQPFYAKDFLPDSELIYGINHPNTELPQNRKILRAPKGLITARTGAGKCVHLEDFMKESIS